MAFWVRIASNLLFSQETFDVHPEHWGPVESTLGLHMLFLKLSDKEEGGKSYLSREEVKLEAGVKVGFKDQDLQGSKVTPSFRPDLGWGVLQGV